MWSLTYVKRMFLACLFLAIGGSVLLFTDTYCLGCISVLVAMAFGLSADLFAEFGPLQSREDAEADLERLYRDLTEGRTAEDDAWDAKCRAECEEAGEFWCVDLREVK